MDLFTLVTLLMVMTALFAYLNTRWLKLPDAIGIMVISLGFSVLLISLNAVHPAWFTLVRRAVGEIDFGRILFDVLLSFLLFAGAFHTDATQLRIERRSVILFALVGTLLSTVFFQRCHNQSALPS